MTLIGFALPLLAQQESGQTEYHLGIGLTVGMVILGLVVICVPRPRTKHYVEPEEDEQPKKKKKKKTKRR